MVIQYTPSAVTTLPLDADLGISSQYLTTPHTGAGNS